MKAKKLPPVERVRELLDYNPDTGVFTWKVSTSRQAKVGDVAGSKHSAGYYRIKVDGTDYFSHRLAWLYHYGEEPADKMIDHINGDKADNRIDNLRLATHKENLRNTKAKGFYFHKSTKKWKAHIQVESRQIHLGLFDCPLLARLAYLDARQQYFGAFA